MSTLSRCICLYRWCSDNWVELSCRWMECSLKVGHFDSGLFLTVWHEVYTQWLYLRICGAVNTELSWVVVRWSAAKISLKVGHFDIWLILTVWHNVYTQWLYLLIYGVTGALESSLIERNDLRFCTVSHRVYTRSLYLPIYGVVCHYWKQCGVLVAALCVNGHHIVDWFIVRDTAF